MEAIEVQTRDLFGWFTEKILEVRRAREKRDVLSEEDPTATIYLAGLLTHMIAAPWLAELDHNGPRLDIDMAQRTSKADTTRQRMEIYRSAADRYLLYLGLWDGLQGRQQGRYYQITEDNLANRACAYYGYAADLAHRLPPPSSQTAKVLNEYSLNLGMYLGILLAMRGDVLHLYPAMTKGEEFHLLHT
ncbi:MAG: hypothetical protein AAB214_07085 [Fibrobacterota bacterium]